MLRLYGAIEEEDNICIVTELVPGGSLFDLIHTKPLLKPEAVIVIGQGRERERERECVCVCVLLVQNVFS